MGFLSRFEGRMEDTFEGAADKMFDAPISPVQIAKKAEKQMRREKMVGAGKQYAPTLYTVLVNPDDDRRLMGYYPTLAGETETYLTAKASEQGLVMDGQPLVRFIVDEDLKHGKFDIIAEAVAAPIIAQLRAEEMHRYGLAAAPAPGGYGAPAQPYPAPRPQAPAPQQYGGYNQGYAAPAPAPAPYGGYDQHDPQGQYDPAPMNVDAYGQPQQLPYVPEDEIDRSIDYGEYTFDSRDFDEQRDGIHPLDRPEAVDPFALGAAAAGAGVAAGAMAGAGMGAAMQQPRQAPQPQPQPQPQPVQQPCDSAAPMPQQPAQPAQPQAPYAPQAPQAPESYDAQSRRPRGPWSTFPYPVLCVLVFLGGGFLFGWWHPGWFVFLTIPLYYWIAHIIENDPNYRANRR